MKKNKSKDHSGYNHHNSHIGSRVHYKPSQIFIYLMLFGMISLACVQIAFF